VYVSVGRSVEGREGGGIGLFAYLLERANARGFSGGGGRRMGCARSALPVRGVDFRKRIFE